MRMPNVRTALSLRAAVLVVALPILGVAACNDSTGPGKEATVVTVDVAKIDGPAYGETPAHDPQVSCGVEDVV